MININKVFFSIKIFFKIFFISIVLNFITLLKSFSEDSKLDILNEEDLLNQISINFPLVASAAEDLKMAEADLKVAKGYFDLILRNANEYTTTGYYDDKKNQISIDQPTTLNGIKLSTGYKLGKGEFPVYREEDRTGEGGEFKTEIEIPLLRDRDIDKPRALLAKAYQEIDIINKTIDEQKIQFRESALNVFWEWNTSAKKLQTLEALLKKAIIRQDQIQNRVRLGDLAKIDSLDNQRTIFQRKNFLLAMQRQLIVSTNELSLYYRDQEGRPINLDVTKTIKKLPKPEIIYRQTLDEYIQEAYKNRPELENLNLQIKQKSIESELAENQILPKVNLGLSAAQDLGARDKTREDIEGRVGIKVEIPLETNLQEGEKELADSKIRQLKIKLDFLKDKITNDVTNVLKSIEINKNRYDLALQELNANKELEKTEAHKYELGDSNLIFLNLREQATAESDLRLIDTILDFKKTLVKFEAILGRRIK